ncbi:MAG TPA: dienelactone hydrolase family protein, partial [Actinomycetota bacterium]|nr:dienelactone hydrolase family protein [Actinomycetota bacterium]
MREEMVEIPVEGAGPLPCFLARADDFPNPSVVVVQEWWGLNDQIRGVAHRLAGERYTAIVPDLYRGAV